MGKQFEIVSTDSYQNDIISGRLKELSNPIDNMATVFDLGENGVLVVPAIRTQQAIKFDSIDSYVDYTTHSGIPLEDPSNLFETRRNDILQLDDDSSELVERITKEYSWETSELLQLMTEQNGVYSLKDFGIQKSSDEARHFIDLGIYFLECLRHYLGGSWKLRKLYGINPYYVPHIVYEGVTYSIWRMLRKQYDKKTINIQELINYVESSPPSCIYLKVRL